MAAPARPLILFDGVCNLCNGAVAWVVRHDTRERFVFASLQSRAAREALDAAGAGTDAPLPDSIVVIDRKGVHTRSDAILRIAAGLGLPWSLAGALRIMPRAVRDWVYAWVARNRYTWFGRRESCMVATPALRARFLDSHELVEDGAGAAGAASAPGATPQDGGADAGVLAAWFVARFFMAYFFIYIFPFPIGVIPGTEWPEAKFTALKQSFVAWIAKVVFGLNITVFPNGSGDTTYNYVEVAVFAVTALIAAMAWTAAKRGRPVSARAFDLMRVYVRVYLAATLFGYGWAKVMPLQMPAPGPDRLLGVIGNMSPMGLLWTFMGASPAYQIFGGLGEVTGGALLLWRRTTLLGALVSTGVMLNIVMLNFCYDVPVKLFSSHLLMMCLFLIAPHTMRLAAILFLNLPAQPVMLRPYPYRRKWPRRAMNVIKVAFVLLAGVFPALSSWNSLYTDGPFAPLRPWDGIYRVESFTRDGIADRALEDSQRWVRFGIGTNRLGGIVRADGTSRRARMMVDENKGTVTITRSGDPTKIELAFRQPERGVLELEGDFEGGTICARMRKEGADAAPLLMTRGFHWINEFPMNR